MRSWHVSMGSFFAIALLASATYLIALGKRGDLDGHEVLVAQTAREMLARNDWVVPHFGGEPRFEKPPLAYWLAATSYQALGRVDEFAARLPSALSAIALALLTFVWTTRHFGSRAGMAAAVVQTTSYWSITYGKSALIDETLTLCCACAILLGWRSLTGSRHRPADPLTRRSEHSNHPRSLRGIRPPSWLHAVCTRAARIVGGSGPILGMWAFTGLALLAKGPVALAIIVPTIVIAFALTRRQRTIVAKTACCMTPSLRTQVAAHLLGLSVFLGIALPWPLAVLSQHPEARAIWLEQSAGRFADRFGPQTRHWHFYLLYVPLLTLPWSPAWILRAMTRFTQRDSSARRRRRVRGDLVAATNAEALLWTWLCVGIVFLSLSAGKREHYILPALTPCSMLAGIQLRHWMGGRLRLMRPLPLAATAVTTCALWTALFDGWVRPNFCARPELRALFDRQRESIAAADRVVQLGSNDRSTVFWIDRPMIWLRAARQASSERQAAVDSLKETDLLLVADEEKMRVDLARWTCLDATEIDDLIGPRRSASWGLYRAKKADRLDGRLGLPPLEAKRAN